MALAMTSVITPPGRWAGYFASGTGAAQRGILPRFGRCGSPLRRAAFELLPLAPVRMPGLVARHAVGKLAVKLVGELGDVGNLGPQETSHHGGMTSALIQ